MPTGNPIMGGAPAINKDKEAMLASDTDFTPGSRVGSKELFSTEERALFNAAAKSLYAVVEQSPLAMKYTDNYAGQDKSGSEAEKTRRINTFIRQQILYELGTTRSHAKPAQNLEEVMARIRDDGKNRSPVEIEDFAIKALSEDPNIKKYFEMRAQVA